MRMKEVLCLKKVMLYIDDILYLAGIGFFTYAGFLVSKSLGFAVLGAGCLYMSRIMAKLQN